MNPTGPITEHFTWEEARCKCRCDIPEHLIEPIRETARFAEVVRESIKIPLKRTTKTKTYFRKMNVPMKVVSWYRCKAYNKQVGGVLNSQHLLGKAIDFVIRESSPKDVQKRITATLFPTIVKGFGKYPGFTHIDRRLGKPRTWVVDTRLSQGGAT